MRSRFLVRYFLGIITEIATSKNSRERRFNLPLPAFHGFCGHGSSSLLILSALVVQVGDCDDVVVDFFKGVIEDFIKNWQRYYRRDDVSKGDFYRESLF